MYSNLYGLKDWEKNGWNFTNGNEARCKLFDLTLRQYITLYDDINVQSLAINCQQLHQAKDFVLGKVLFLGLSLVSGVVDPIQDEVITEIVHGLLQYTNCYELDFTNKPKLYSNEVLHVQAVILWSEHKFAEAIALYRSMLEVKPTDLLALKFCHDLCFYTGAMGDICGHYPATLKRLDKCHPLYSYILAMYSFAKIELLDYDVGEKLALQSLAMNPHNAWATHSMCHIYAMRCELMPGIDFVQRTKDDWAKSDYLACHIYWHLGLMYLENNDIGQAYAIFSQQLQARAKSSLSLFHLSDAVSLLFRLQCTTLISSYRQPERSLSLADPFKGDEDWQGQDGSCAFWADWCSLSLEVGARYAGVHFWPFNDAHLCLLLGTTDNLMRRVIAHQGTRHVPGLTDKGESVAEAYDNYQTTFSSHIKTMQRRLPQGKGARWLRLKTFIGALSRLLANLTSSNRSVESLGEVMSSAQTLASTSCADPNAIVSQSLYQCNFCWLGGSLPQREVFTLTIITAYLLCARESRKSMQRARKVATNLNKVRKTGPWLSQMIASREGDPIDIGAFSTPCFRDSTLKPM